MINPGSKVGAEAQKAAAASGGGLASPEHYLRLILHRKWIVLGVFAVVSLGTAIVARMLPDVFTSETVILVDPQKVPESYVKPTVSGDIRNRLGTLSQQILSATRLQTIIDKFNLYPEERKNLAREDVITQMRHDISVTVVSDFGASQDLQAFRISYSGTDARLVAQVTNELASLFIEENLNARAQQATGTSEFLSNQLQESRKALEEQESKLKNFKLKHVGEMPEQQDATIQLLGQVQSQLQSEADALSRAENQRSMLQSMMTQSAPVVDLDETNAPAAPMERKPPEAAKPQAPSARARLAAALARYTEKHPDVQKLKQEVAEEEAREAQAASAAARPAAKPAAEPEPRRAVRPPAPYVNPVVQAQIKTLDAEIAKHKDEQQRLSKLAATYRSKLEAVPVREQEITELVRDYEISRSHYSRLLENQLSAETATQLEIRQKGEKFSVLDRAQVPERPSRPNRTMINIGGALGGLLLGILLAVATDFMSLSITTPQDVTAISGLAVLGTIPLILTAAERRARRKWILLATASAVVTALAFCAVLYYHYRNQI